ncbi:MAG: hypothetical protein H6569_00975 [Lewinellaceae bacterium]|nr:hypothetical protein [Lewinellaceae bacterium]
MIRQLNTPTHKQIIRNALAAFGLAFFFAVILFSCDSGKRDIRAYYFPVDSLTTGQVYAYVSEDGTTGDQSYWYYQTIKSDSGTFLVGTQYDRFFEVNQIVREKIVENGSLARECFLYEPDTSTGKSIAIHTAIESANLFPFQVTDSLGVFLYRIKYAPPAEPEATIYLIRNRRYLGDGPDFAFEGKAYPTIRFGIREAIGHSAEGTAEIEGEGEEWYAKGLGLVYYRKSYGTEHNIEYAFMLRERFPMEELVRRAQ